jgi:rhomboid protease GluP
MADCTRCGRKLPALSFGKDSDVCSSCRQADSDIQPGGHVSQLVPAWRTGPSVTMAIIAINVAVFLAMTLSGASPTEPTNLQLVRWGADFGPYTFGGQPWRALTSAFVHIGIIHIAMNMWCLWNLGRMAEQIYDKGTYIGTYLLCGIGGSIASLAWQPMVVSAGASGAIFGIAGLLITTFWMGNLPIPREQTSATMRSLLAFAGYNLLFGAAVPGISNSAHMGGLFTGLILGGLMAPRLTRDHRESQGLRWLIMGGAAVALLFLFQFVKARLLAGN